MATVLVRVSETEWIPLELIEPRNIAQHYLSEVEFNLIFMLQPKLNEDGKKQLKAKIFHYLIINDPHMLLESNENMLASRISEF